MTALENDFLVFSIVWEIIVAEAMHKIAGGNECLLKFVWARV